MSSNLLKIISFGVFTLGESCLKFILNKKTFSNFLYKKHASKISRNYIALLHAISALTLSGLYLITKLIFLYNWMSIISTGYFLFDFYYIILFENINFLRLLYIYHHICSIYILTYGPDCQVYRIIFWAEVSNIPSYIVYHLIKTNPSSVILKKWKFIQKIIYTIVRIPILGYQSYYIYWAVEDKTPFFIGFPVYLIGFIWTLFILISS